MSTDICLDSLKECEPDCPCPLDVWVHLPPNEQGYRYVRRKRWRTYLEIYNRMHAFLDRIECEGCGYVLPKPKKHNWWHNPPKCKKCGKDGWFEWIDEYDSMGQGSHQENTAILPMDEGWDLVHAMAYCCVGGNEGYQAHLTLDFRKGRGCVDEDRSTVHPYWIKSFRGMDHVHKLAKYMTIAVGAWPNYKGEFDWPPKKSIT